MLKRRMLIAQKWWTEPEDIDPNDSVKIFVDLTKMDCDKLVGNAGPLYIWTWQPADPVAGNGDWDNSNEDMIMTNEGPDIWSITILPVDFYGVSAQEVYDNNIHFLVKADDGGSGGDCSVAGDENKTEDLEIEVEVRPRSVSGVLLAVHGKMDYLILQIVEGQVSHKYCFLSVERLDHTRSLLLDQPIVEL